MTVTQKIIEIFEDYLEEKGINIDNPEREEDDFASLIYGTEYGDLESKITEVIENEHCLITTNLPAFKAELKVEHDVIHIKSNSLSDYIEEYSME